MEPIIFVNKLEYWRTELGFKTKRQFAEWLGVDEFQYNRWSNQKVQPKLEQFIYLRNQIRRRVPDLTIDDLIYEVPKK